LVILQDNAAIHKTQEIMDYLEKEAPYYHRNHPALSPDLNIMEDIWSQMDAELNKYKIKDLPSLKRHLKKVWEDVSLEKVRNSVDSMPRRLKQCISLNGERTNY